MPSSQEQATPVVTTSEETSSVVHLISVLPSAAPGGMGDQGSVPIQSSPYGGILSDDHAIQPPPRFRYLEYQLRAAQFAGEKDRFPQFPSVPYRWYEASFGFPPTTTSL